MANNSIFDHPWTSVIAGVSLFGAIVYLGNTLSETSTASKKSKAMSQANLPDFAALQKQDPPLTAWDIFVSAIN